MNAARTVGVRSAAWRGVLGLEPNPALYVEHLVGIFREVWRVLKDDGTLWINLGDTYSSQPAGNKVPSAFSQTRPSRISGNGDQETVRLPKRDTGLKPKDLVGIPWRVAFALQADGWYLRSDIIWAKSNPMPESVRDRPTKAHEYIFLLAKNERYFFNQNAVREPLAPHTLVAYPNGPGGKRYQELGSKHGQPVGDHSGIQKWRASPKGWDASRSEGSFHRLGREGRNSRMHVDRDPAHTNYRSGNKERRIADGKDRQRVNSHLGSGVPWEDTGMGRNIRTVWIIASQPYSGAHFATFPEAIPERCIKAGSRPGDLVLDPFAGTGTVGRVAERLNRRWVCLDLKYQDLSRERTRRVQKELLHDRLQRACRSPEDVDEQP